MVSRSNLCRDIDYPDKRFVIILSPSPKTPGQYLKLGYSRFLSNPFQFITYQSSYHSTLYRLSRKINDLKKDSFYFQFYHIFIRSPKRILILCPCGLWHHTVLRWVATDVVEGRTASMFFAAIIIVIKISYNITITMTNVV